MAYLYETHLHTSEASACGRSRGRDYVSRYKDLGYAGIIVTDHFCGGYSAISKNLSWVNWVHQFCLGYESARDEGSRRGLDVFFGWEETFDGDDYLVYGLDKEWLLTHPEVKNWTRKKQHEEVRRYGGCVVQAHPFRQVSYIRRIHLNGTVDAVEAANGGNLRPYDALAMSYAQKLGVPVTAGTDIHYAEEIDDNRVFGVYLDTKIKTIDDYVKVIRNNAITGLKIPPGRCDLQGDENIFLPVDIQDCNQNIKKHLESFSGI